MCRLAPSLPHTGHDTQKITRRDNTTSPLSLSRRRALTFPPHHRRIPPADGFLPPDRRLPRHLPRRCRPPRLLILQRRPRRRIPAGQGGRGGGGTRNQARVQRPGAGPCRAAGARARARALPSGGRRRAGSETALPCEIVPPVTVVP
jgi:hypothetical protein